MVRVETRVWRLFWSSLPALSACQPAANACQLQLPAILPSWHAHLPTQLGVVDYATAPLHPPTPAGKRTTTPRYQQSWGRAYTFSGREDRVAEEAVIA